MPNYITTSEDLTSIANAIRIASGENSSLVYPTGFVNKIEELSKYNWMGGNAQLIDSKSETICLADTSMTSYTPSSSNTNIINGETHYMNSDGYVLSQDYDYIIITDTIVDYAYTTPPSTYNHIGEYYFTGSYGVVTRPSNWASLEQNLDNYVSYFSTGSISIMKVNQPSGTYTLSGNNYGLHCAMMTPALSNQYNQDFTCKPRYPTLRANANDGYMAAEAYSNLDLNNSMVYFYIYLYRINHNNIMHGMWNHIKNVYNTYNTNT